ncbi:MAG: 30S ribosomal protein S1 [Thermodesulfobacteriota bacterium]
MTENSNNDSTDKAPDSGEQEPTSAEDFMAMYEESLKAIKSGHVIEGEIVDIEKDNVLIDIGYKSEGLVSKKEFLDADGRLNVHIGDRVEVYLIRKEEDGYPVLSREEAIRDKRFDTLKEAYENDRTVEGTIVSRIKGGYVVDIGLNAFLPASQLDDKPVKNPEEWLNQSFVFKIVQFNKQERNVVLSRRVLIEEERKRLSEKTLSTVKEGDIVEGTVKNITDYGLFVDIGGINGLVHISNISWGPVRHPSEFYAINDTVQVKILDIDAENKKISLGIKQLTPDPWENVAEKYPVGATVTGRVLSLKNYGAFVSLEEGIVGLIGLSDLSWTQKIRHPNQVLKIDDEIECQVLSIDADKRQMSLGLKQLEANPWDTLHEHYPEGSVIEGVVKQVTDFGIFIGITEEIDGLAHVSDLPQGQKKIDAHYRKGQPVQAKILEIDRKNERVKLGIKQLAPDPWTILPEKYPPGTTVSGKIANIAEFGIFVEIEQQIQGLVHISEIPHETGENPLERFAIGDSVEACVLEIKADQKKVRLSMKADALEKAREPDQSEESTGFGSLLKEKMAQQKENDT